MVWYVQIKRLLSLYIAGRCGGERGTERIGNFTEPRKQRDLLLWSVCRNPQKNLCCANHHFISDPWRNKVKTERDFQKYQMEWSHPFALKNALIPFSFIHPYLTFITLPSVYHWVTHFQTVSLFYINVWKPDSIYQQCCWRPGKHDFPTHINIKLPEWYQWPF